MTNVSFAALGLLLALGACATKVPTFGDEIRASAYGDLARDWDRANEAREKAQGKLDDANRKVRRGENLIAEAREDMRRGENMIEDGQRDVRRYEGELAAAKARVAEIEARYRIAAGEPKAQ